MVNKADVFSTHVWKWNIETCQSHFTKGKGKREINGGNELSCGTLYTYMELSQQNPLYNYYTVIKSLKKIFFQKFNRLSFLRGGKRKKK
jgi:hypothetical protein